MISPTEADINRRVIYTGNRYSGGKPEEGSITSFNTAAVFVRYDGQRYSMATSRADLEYEHYLPVLCRCYICGQEFRSRAPAKDCGGHDPCDEAA